MEIRDEEVADCTLRHRCQLHCGGADRIPLRAAVDAAARQQRRPRLIRMIRGPARKIAPAGGNIADVWRSDGGGRARHGVAGGQQQQQPGQRKGRAAPPHFVATGCVARYCANAGWVAVRILSVSCRSAAVMKA